MVRKPEIRKCQAAFAALGRFYQEFGQACFALQLLIQGILQQKGGLKDQNMAWIILGNEAINASTLISMAQHLVGYVSGGKDEPVFADIAKRFVGLTEQRNDLAHGLASLAGGTSKQLTGLKLGALKISSNKHGYSSKSILGSTEELQQLIADAQEIASLIQRYSVCLLAGFKIESNFVRRDKHWRFAPDAEGQAAPAARLAEPSKEATGRVGGA